MIEAKSSIVLIGMPGAGKSTVGVLLAKALGKGFVDTDVYIQALEGARLQEIIDDKGLDAFCAIEENHLLSIDQPNCVIATGGSAVYSKKAMAHLKNLGTVVYLSLSIEQIQNRVTNLATRGVVMEPNQDLPSLYTKRKQLYENYAEVTIDCDSLSIQQTLAEIINAVS